MPLDRTAIPIQGLQQSLGGIEHCWHGPSYRIHWARKGKVYPMATRRERAQRLLRWLTKQHGLVTYTDVAEFLGGTPYFVTPDLGCLSRLLQELQERERRRNIPLIQLIVVSKRTGAPGCGGAEFLKPPIDKKDFLALTPKQRCVLMESDQKKALRYPHWDSVIKGVEALPDGSGV